MVLGGTDCHTDSHRIGLQSDRTQGNGDGLRADAGTMDGCMAGAGPTADRSEDAGHAERRGALHADSPDVCRGGMVATVLFWNFLKPS